VNESSKPLPTSSGGKLVIVTAPSGAGKTSIVRYLLGHFPQLAFSVSATTRPRREHEQDGRDYYFLKPDDFALRRERGDFLETEEVYPGIWYGTLKIEVERIWRSGRHVIFDVDVRGARNLCKAYPQQSFSIFVSPPSFEHLEERLRGRRTESEETLQVRLTRAREELQHAGSFDYLLLNDELERACREAGQVVEHFLGH
jgi:guanylate kinase